MTIEPRPIRRPCSRLSSAIASPIRVPPDQSLTAAAARASARSESRPRSSRVTRVSRVPNTNASTRARAATHACMYCRSMPLYGAIEPLTSQISTSRRGRIACSR